MIESSVPSARIRRVNQADVRVEGAFVLYWMTANRRLEWNFALQRAVDRARALRRPLLVFEPLRVDYRWAADRFHRFVMDGMADNHRGLESSTISYFPYVEPAPGHGADLLAGLARSCSLMVTDDSPISFYPRMIAAAGKRFDVAVEAVDSGGLLPVGSCDRDYPTAHGFRRFLQKELPGHLEELPSADAVASANLVPLERSLSDLVPGFAPTPPAALVDPATERALPIDHDVPAVPVRGGSGAARDRLLRFIADRLPAYGTQRNHPDADKTSGLSAYLHFGHISSHEIFATVAAEELWSPASLSTTADGSREGWWGMSASSEAFLDQVVTWRELGINTCYRRDDYDEYSSLPEWARVTLGAHRDDERPHVYGLDVLDASATHDEIWNAAQNQLVVEGRIHNYLRMLWGKKILEWSASPEQALAAMIELNNKYALDGRDPNSYAGIFWVLGRYDRAWGPERPIFGKVRYMTSANTARKLRLKGYLETHGSRRSAMGRPA